jgi:transposase
MLNVSPTTRVFVATAPVDLRGSFNRLFALTQTVLQQDPLSGHWFVFTNRRHNRVKILYWDGSGLWVCANKHAPQCSLWLIKTPLPLPSAVRNTA